MLKKVLKSVLVLTLVATTGVGATRAYFTAKVVAEDNQVQTGTMIAYLGTYMNTTGGKSGRWVAYYDKDGNHYSLNDAFYPITNVQPGEVQSTYLVVANKGSLPFRYRMKETGSWTNTSLEKKKMEAVNYHRFPANDCKGDKYCEGIYYWLNKAGYTNVSAGWSNLTPDSSSYVGGDSSSYELGNKEFTVYRVDFKLNEDAGNEYQDEVYNYDMTVDAKQVNAPSF